LKGNRFEDLKKFVVAIAKATLSIIRSG